MKVVIKVLRAIIAIIIMLVLLLNIWLLFDQFVLKENPAQVFGYSQLVVTSGSMEDTLSIGDVVIVKPKKNYLLGDIITFRVGGGDTLVTHRIVGEHSKGFITKGDANNTEDKELVPPENIVGEVVTNIPNMGNVILFLKSPFGILILIVVGFLLFKLPEWLGGKDKEPERYAHERDKE